VFLNRCAANYSPITFSNFWTNIEKYSQVFVVWGWQFDNAYIVSFSLFRVKQELLIVIYKILLYIVFGVPPIEFLNR